MIVENIMDAQIIDLGTAGDARFAGILVPDDGHTRERHGVTAQFLEDAETYHRKYFDIGYAKYLIAGALDAVKIQGETSLILDIGSGSGPSVFALMDIFPRTHIVATDISPNLLAILRGALAEKHKTASCTTICLDLNRHWFKGQPFDLAIGSAILHHLFQPQRLVEQVFSAIRPGGAIVFFEPFEPGYTVMAMIYRAILSHANFANPLNGTLHDFFRGKVAQIAQMKCEEKDPVLYASIDDKWLFTREYLAEIGEHIGASKTIIYPINHSDRPFTNHMKTALRLGLGMEPSAMPDWAWEIITDIEDSCSDACKKDFIIEGCIAFVRGA